MIPGAGLQKKKTEDQEHEPRVLCLPDRGVDVRKDIGYDRRFLLCAPIQESEGVKRCHDSKGHPSPVPTKKEAREENLKLQTPREAGGDEKKR